MGAYEDLVNFQSETEALAQISGRLGWDQETMMPRGAAGQRAAESAALEAVLHARRSDPRIADWLAAIPETQDPVAAATLREIRISYERATKIPARLSTELARITSISQGEWAAARAADDFSAFAPRLEEVVALKREEAACLAGDGDLYDALLNDYEPGATSADLDAMFGALRPGLVALREKILAAKQEVASVSGPFDEAAQLALSAGLAKTFGYDLNRGRIDKAVHPFSSGSGADVRITTRTDVEDPFNCIYSTIHEVGHACYEQNIEDSYGLTPLGRGVSMGVHESQSRIYENQFGRSEEFTSWLYEQMKSAFPAADLGVKNDFYRTVNNVETGFIRTEADEIHYNLHVLMRYDLERDLIRGKLEVRDLEMAWNQRFKADFGMDVPKASLGVLQDVHWSVGLFGYFPTYTLGNVYAGCLYEEIQRVVPGFEGDLAKGDTSRVMAWLKENLQQHGALRSPRDTIRHATGKEPSEAPLLAYLERKFGAIYMVG